MFLLFSGLLPRLLLPLLLGLLCGFGPALAAAGRDPLPARRVAENVYVIPARIADATPANRGRVVNTGFIVGREGVIVIDSGANHRHGEAILAAVAQVTPKPVLLLIDSHPHPQNVLGNSAFAERGIPILATAATASAMQQRCPHCLDSLGRSVGPEAMRGTRIQLPQRTLEATQNIEVAGRRLRLLFFGHAHTEGDLAVFDEPSATLFAGDLVYRRQVPHFSEANSAGWLAAVEQLAAVPFRVLVPGRGAVGGSEVLAPMQRYLQQLRERVAAAYRAGRSADETIALAGLPEFRAWHGYEERHGRNVQHVYYEIEQEDFGRVGEDSQ